MIAESRLIDRFSMLLQRRGSLCSCKDQAVLSFDEIPLRVEPLLLVSLTATPRAIRVRYRAIGMQTGRTNTSFQQPHVAV